MSVIVAGCVSAPIGGILVQPGDLVQVCITTTASQFSLYTVDTKGRIDLPLIGSVTIAGQTADQVVETLLKLYDKNHHPDMSIIVKIVR
jgi:protein involved in polysaccharide export with SLBB domain